MNDYPKAKDNLSIEEKRTRLKKALREKAAKTKTAHPLSYGQKALWFLYRSAPKSAAYNVAAVARVHSVIHAPVLRDAFQTLLDRHPTLRATFSLRDDQPIQIIHGARTVDFEEIDASGESEEGLHERVAAAYRHPFDLEQGPLLRVSLFTRAPEDHVLLMASHHIACDGWSTWLLISELLSLYAARKADQAALLSPLQWQYQDFVRWQAELLEGPAGEKSWQYWRKHLDGALPVLDLPTDRPRPPVQSTNGATINFTLPAALAEGINHRARTSGATLYMILMAAFQVLLHRYTGQDDIIVGSPTVGRSRSEFEAIVGYFVNSLPLRANLAGDPPFGAFLKQVRETMLGGLAHQDYPFPLLVERLQPARDASRSPLFQALFVLQKIQNDDELSTFLFDAGDGHAKIEKGGLLLTPFKMPQQEGQFDLTLEMIETKQSLSGAFSYNRDLFDADTIVRMIGHFQSLLEGIVTEPETRISQLPLLTEAERQRILVAWNDTKTPYPADKCVQELFEEQAAKTPDAVAVVFENEEVTYGELNARANRLAHRLRVLGVEPEVLVGLFVERSVGMVVDLLAILKAGGAYVPLDPEYPTDRLAFMAEDAGLAMLLCHGATRDRLPKCAMPILDLDAEAAAIAEERSDNPARLAKPDNLAYVIYTSGSTGRPKGVCIEHKSVGNLIAWHCGNFSVTPEDHCTQVASLSFDAAVWEIWPILAKGATLHIASPQIVSDPAAIQDWMTSQGITISFLPTPLAQAVVSEKRVLPGSLRFLLTGGDQFRIPIPTDLPFQVVNNYGPTENTVVTTSCAIEPGRSLPPIGSPIANTKVYILDSERQPTPIGVPGELYIGGASLARGYLNRPDLTFDKFIPDPFSDETISDDTGTRLYRTGDACRWLPDGTIEFLGRIDTQVKIRGFRIECGEVENALLADPDVREALVDARGEGVDKRLIAWVVMERDIESTSPNDLRTRLRARLPDWMLPSVFVSMPALPLTPNGKIDRRALPDPDTSGLSAETAYVAPRNSLEDTLHGIFIDVLGVERIGVFDNFFDLGGHSLLAVRMIEQIRNVCSVELPLHSLFDSPTIAGIAKAIDLACTETVATDIDLEAEAVLDADIGPPPSSLSVEVITKPRAVLLTGATGFVGIYLLHELLTRTEADICCLVRAKDAEKGKQRLEDKLKSCLIWEEAFDARIIPVIGDLSQPLLGLSASQFDQLAARIDVIYHNGAWVNHLYPYTVLKAINVLGTQEILRLGVRNRAKPVHFISTYALSKFQVKDGIPVKGQFVNGYLESKWVAERLLNQARERGLSVSIYRLDRVTGHSRTGVSNQADFLNLLLKGCIQLGKAPLIGNVKEHLTPVDYVSRAVIHLSQQPESLGKTFNLIPPHPPVRWQELFFKRLPAFGYPIKRTLYATWREQLGLQTTNALYPLLPVFPQSGGGVRQVMALLLPFLSLKPGKSVDDREAVDAWDTVRELADAGIVCPAVDDQVLNAYFSYFWNSGFLEEPTHNP